MSAPLRILMLEDSAKDAELAIAALEEAGYCCEWKRVENREDFLACLTAPEYDVVLSDCKLPSFDGLTALSLFKETALDLPFIFVTGALGEERATETLRKGATDYVLKTHLLRLGPVVERALKEKEERRLREKAEQALRRQAEIINQVHDAIVSTDLDGYITSWNRGAERLLGYSAAEALGKHISIIYWKDEAEFVQRQIIAALMQRGSYNIEVPVRAKTGEHIYVNMALSLVRDKELTPVGMIGYAVDVTERRNAEKALRESEELNQAVLASLAAHVAVLDKDGNILAMNQAWENFACNNGNAALSGVCIGTNYLEVCRKSALESVPEARDALVGIEAVLSGSESQFLLEYPCDVNNQKHWFLMVVTPLARKNGGVVLSHLDITERKDLEEKLRQAQRLEAVGQLAGGVAHDFNNLLTVIGGYSSLLLRSVGENEETRQKVQEIKKAADRATTLTRQLLAFSRKQVLQPRVLDLNVVVAEMDKMLRRLIGEDISLTINLEPALGQIKADPGQIEQVIMNLAVNARDAMPKGGKLTIETAHVLVDDAYTRRYRFISPGRYVVLSVSDIGCGMDRETQSRVFEPFFTTKPLGKGTGLGLSTVYGIVKQSEGSISVHSELGKGTTFKIYLPRLDQPLEHDRTAERSTELVKGSETLLLAEDEDVVRQITQELLEMSGYKVLATTAPEEALRLFEEHQDRIDLLVTDVIMPNMSGRELAQRITRLRPETKVLYISGYTDDAIIRHGVLEAGIAFIQKPFSPATLSRKVREILDS